MLKTLLVLGAISAIGSNFAYAQTNFLASSSASFKLMANVEVLASNSHTQAGFVELLIDGKKGGYFGCDSIKTLFKWPGLSEKLKDYPAYNFPFPESLVQEIDILSQEDFYCDTFTGKDRADVFKTYLNLKNGRGKKFELRVEGTLATTILKDSRKRIETVNLTSVEFYEGSRLAIKFARGETTIDGGYAILSWTGVQE